MLPFGFSEGSIFSVLSTKSSVFVDRVHILRLLSTKSSVFVDEMSRLGCECPEPGYCYTIEHGGYKKENIDIEYCEQVASMAKDSDIIKFKQIPEAAEAVCMKVYGPYGRLNENIREVLERIEANGYTITYPPRYSPSMHHLMKGIRLSNS